MGSFSTKCCKCRKTDIFGICRLSHWNAQHIDNFDATNEGNLASIQDPDPIPSGIPAVTTKEPSASPDVVFPEVNIEIVSAWCAPVVSFADPDLTPHPSSPHHEYPSSDESVNSGGGGAWCVPVDVSDVTLKNGNRARIFSASARWRFNAQLNHRDLRRMSLNLPTKLKVPLSSIADWCCLRPGGSSG